MSDRQLLFFFELFDFAVFNVADIFITVFCIAFILYILFGGEKEKDRAVDAFDEDDPASVKHIDLAEKTDLILIAPATANIIGKIASGIADDLLTSVYLAYINKPVIVCPAMNTNMYENQATQENLRILKDRGVTIVEPKVDHLACGTTGKGALADIDTVLNCIESFAA